MNKLVASTLSSFCVISSVSIAQSPFQNYAQNAPQLPAWVIQQRKDMAEMRNRQPPQWVVERRQAIQDQIKQRQQAAAQQPASNIAQPQVSNTAQRQQFVPQNQPFINNYNNTWMPWDNNSSWMPWNNWGNNNNNWMPWNNNNRNMRWVNPNQHPNQQNFRSPTPWGNNAPNNTNMPWNGNQQWRPWNGNNNNQFDNWMPWGNNNWDGGPFNGNGFGNMFGDMDADMEMDFDFKFRGTGDANANGQSNSNNNWSGQQYQQAIPGDFRPAN